MPTEKISRFENYIYVLNTFMVIATAVFLVYYNQNYKVLGISIQEIFQQAVTIPEWFSIVMLVIICLLSIMGCIGAYMAKNAIIESKVNPFLIVYLVLLLGSFVALVVFSISTGTVLRQVVLGLDNGYDPNRCFGTDNVRCLDILTCRILASDEQAWKDLQDLNQCCGCGSFTDTSGQLVFVNGTGDICPPYVNMTQPPESCYGYVYGQLEIYFSVLSALGVASVIFVLLGILAAALLGCCASYSQAVRQNTILFMPQYEWLPESGRPGSMHKAAPPSSSYVPPGYSPSPSPSKSHADDLYGNNSAEFRGDPRSSVSVNGDKVITVSQIPDPLRS